MTAGHSGRVALVWALGLALAFGSIAAALSERAWSTLPRPHSLEELAYYPSGVHLRPAALGHTDTAADLAWLRAVQYYGEHRVADNRFERMEHVFDILTTLAPGFIPAYVFGGFALAQEGRNFPAAQRLMQKGIDANPRCGQLAFELGFLYYVRPGQRDLDRAAEYFQLASFQPDAPPQARRFAAYARQNHGDLMLSYELWSEVYRTSRNAYLRETALREMGKITQAIQTGRAELAQHRLGTPGVIVSP